MTDFSICATPIYIMKYLLFLFLFIHPVLLYAQSIDPKALFQEVDESISGVIIKGRSVTYTPKDVYNKQADLQRERTKRSQKDRKRRANLMLRRMAEKQVEKIMQDPTEIMNIDTDKIANIMSVGSNFDDPDVMHPVADEDVTHRHDFETRYKNGVVLKYSEMYPDSARTAKAKNMMTRFKAVYLHTATEDISIIIPIDSKFDGEPGSYITKHVTPKTKPDKSLMGARAYGRGLSYLSITGMEKARDVENASGDLFTVSVGGTFEYQSANITVDRSKGYCWTDKYFYNSDGLYIEEHASDFRQVDGVWFPFHLETTMHLPEYEWTDGNKIRRKTVTDISSIEFDPDMVLNEENMLEEEMEIVETHQSSSFDGIISTQYNLIPKR